MKSQALQEMIKKVFSDEKTKLQFMSNPESVIAQFKLTEQEKTAVLNTHARLGLATADSQQLEAIIEPLSNWL
ncbi:MAG TPA: hypothetical protein G4O12_08150 [Dehalococcoidia bacterium]|jgi:hypothetical protein|nr:hypothetical protein [Dehalococcoidia bacterium]